MRWVRYKVQGYEARVHTMDYTIIIIDISNVCVHVLEGAAHPSRSTGNDDGSFGEHLLKLGSVQRSGFIMGEGGEKGMAKVRKPSY